MADRYQEFADGVLARYRVPYRYVFIETDRDLENGLDRLVRQLKGWEPEAVRKRFGEPDEDLLGRPALISFQTGYRCPDLAGMAGSHPVVNMNSSGQPSVFVAMATCRECPMFRDARHGRKRSCAAWPEERAAWSRSAPRP